MDNLTEILEQLKDSSNKIEKILDRSENYKSDITTINLKFDLLKEELQSINKVIYGDSNNDPILTTIKILGMKVTELEKEIDSIYEASEKRLEQDKTRFQKIIITIIGGLVTIISSALAYFLDFGNSKH